MENGEFGWVAMGSSFRVIKNYKYLIINNNYRLHPLKTDTHEFNVFIENAKDYSKRGDVD